MLLGSPWPPRHYPRLLSGSSPATTRIEKVAAGPEKGLIPKHGGEITSVSFDEGFFLKLNGQGG